MGDRIGDLGRRAIARSISHFGNSCCAFRYTLPQNAYPATSYASHFSASCAPDGSLSETSKRINAPAKTKHLVPPAPSVAAVPRPRSLTSCANGVNAAVIRRTARNYRSLVIWRPVVIRLDVRCHCWPLFRYQPALRRAAVIPAMSIIEMAPPPWHCGAGAYLGR